MSYRKFLGLFTAETPLSHQADEKMETTIICRYNIAVKDGRYVKVYNISANAFRNAVRRNGAQRLLDLIGMKIEDLPEIANVVLFSGGPRLEKSVSSRYKGEGKSKSSGGQIPIEYSNTLCRWFPLLDLLGCTTQFCMVPHDGSKMAPTSLNALTPEIASFKIESSVIDAHEIKIESLPGVVTEFQFNSKQDSRVRYDFLHEEKEKVIFEEGLYKRYEDVQITLLEESDKGNNPQGKSECGEIRNVFDVQYICKGTLLAHQVAIFDRPDGILTSCFSSALEQWKRDGGYIAGKIAQGAGVVSWRYIPNLLSPEKYENFITENKRRLKSMLEDRDIWKSEKVLMRHCE